MWIARIALAFWCLSVRKHIYSDALIEMDEIAADIAFISTGFVKTSSAPHLLNSVISKSIAFPVTPNIDPLKPKERICFAASGPLKIGMTESIKMASKPQIDGLSGDITDDHDTISTALLPSTASSS